MFTHDHDLIAGQKCRRMPRIVRGGLHELPINFRISGLFDVLESFFCKICETAICKSCGLTDHKGHAKILLEEAGDDRK